MSLCSLVLGGLMMFGGSPNMKGKPIKVAYDMPWKSIHPGLQHTAIADFVLSNQFEALVGYDENNSIVPLGAKSWEVNDDMTVYRFTIDTLRKFSDGSSLTSYDYKRSWEEALALTPKSSNSSLADVLHMLEGSEEFEKLGFIRGIETPDEKTLILKFKNTYRTALDYLHGNRLSAYKKDGDNYIGTGAFKLREEDSEKLSAEPNPFSSLSDGENRLEMVIVKPSEVKEKLENGDIDIYAFAAGSRTPDDYINGKDIEVLVGQDAINEALSLNALKGRIFSDKRMRKALLYLIHSLPENVNSMVENPKFFTPDPQALLQFQAGRLEDSEARRFIEDGKQYLKLLQNESKQRPLVIYFNEGEEWFLSYLEEHGVHVDKELSKQTTPSEKIANYYKEHLSDIQIIGYSIAGADPDSVYHVLGRHGAITSPMIQNEIVATLLEDGRQIVDADDLNDHYQKFSRAFLDEVPLIHLGFSKAITAYNKKHVGIDRAILRRNNGHLYPFYRK